MVCTFEVYEAMQFIFSGSSDPTRNTQIYHFPYGFEDPEGPRQPGGDDPDPETGTQICEAIGKINKISLQHGGTYITIAHNMGDDFTRFHIGTTILTTNCNQISSQMPGCEI